MNSERHNVPTSASSDAALASIAPALAPSDSTSVQYSWSTDGETFHDQCDSVAAAIAAAIDYTGDLEVGQTIYIGEVSEISTPRLIDASNIVERMQEMAFEYAGEPSEDYLASVTSEQLDDLQKLVATWADSVERPQFWQVRGALPHVVTAEDFGQTCEAGQPECGPVKYYDSEGVPLCAVCWQGLLADSADANAAEVKS